MKLQGSGYNPQRTQRSAQLYNLSKGVEKTPKEMLQGKRTAVNPQMTITPRLLNAIKASPKGVLPPSLNKFRKTK